MKKFIRFICFLLVLGIVLVCTYSLLYMNNRKDSLHIKGYFKEPENTIDVVVIGASEVYTGFNSPLAWDDCGFTSYSVSFAGAPGSLYQSMLTEALTTQNPKLVAFEINGFLCGDEYLNSRAKMHTWFDNIPDSPTKWEALEKLVEQDELAEFRFPFLKYHDNWRHPLRCGRNLLDQLLFLQVDVSETKCFGTTTSRKESAELEKFKPKFQENSRKYLESLLQFCKDQGLEQVLFFRSPHSITNTAPEVYDQIAALIQEYGYDFANFEHAFEETGLDPQNDFYNKDHLNIYGAEKTTAFLSNYFCTHYDIKTDHPQEVIAQWNTSAEKMKRIVAQCKEDIEAGKCSFYHELSELDF